MPATHYRRRADDIIQGLSGLAALMERQSGEPRYLPTVAADKTCGLVAAHAILAAARDGQDLRGHDRDGLREALAVLQGGDRPLRIENGFAYPSEKPGWGFSFKPAALRELKVG